MMQCISKEGSMRAKQLLCFNNNRAKSEDGASKMCKTHSGFGYCLFKGVGFIVVDP